MISYLRGLMLQALDAITFTAQRIHMGLIALAGTTFTAERDALPVAPLLPAGLPTVAVDKAAVNASFGFTFPAHNDLDVIHPDKLYVCLFAPGAEVPTDPAEIIAKSVAFGSTDLFPPGIAEEQHAESVATVIVPTPALFPARVNSIEGVIAIPVINIPDAV
jgi:hypothetical protein